jgi:flagellar basal body P-ring formation protein FlgA
MPRNFIAAVLVTVALAAPAAAQVTGALPPAAAPPSTPILKRSVTVASDIVRIGDLIDNAGEFAGIPVFRSPDVGTTGAVPARKIVEAARAHNMFGVEYGDVVEVEVTRAGRVITKREIEARIARLFAGTSGISDTTDLQIRFDREAVSFVADLAPGADLKAMRAVYDTRAGRFDVVFEVPIGVTRRTLMRYTGSLVEIADAVVPNRTIGRGEIVKAADVSVERRPRSEVTVDVPASISEVVGRAARQALRVGQPLHRSDLAKPELVKRDENVTLVYQIPGIMLSSRGKALEAGGEGDVINVLNVQSKRNIQGVITGPGRVAISPVGSSIIAAVNPSQPVDNESAGNE